MFECVRVQGALVENKEVQAIVAAIKENNESYFDETVAEYINNVGSSSSEGSSDDSEGGAVDPQYIKALAIVVKLGQASISLIQRKCSVGYNHAGKIIEWMEAMGYISPFDGKAKARSVVLTKEQYERKYGSLD
jgi:S-DNA-T family DNA segregation ATPase FtsK/SpoIIIE